MRSAAFCSLGCKVNQYETDAIQESFSRAGYEIRSFTEPADVYVINTCTVTNIADRKSRQMLHRARSRSPRAVVVAVGCYVETAPQVLEEDGAVDILVGNADKSRIVELVDDWLDARKQALSKEKAPAAKIEAGMLEESEEGYQKKLDAAADTGQEAADARFIVPSYEQMTPGTVNWRARAYLKIQDGCNQFCSYCIIPYARGRVKSRTPGDILHEVRQIAAAGYKELVITGIHISSYGLDFGERDEVYGPFGGDSLIRLTEAIAQVDGIERIRLGSLEPRIITEPFLERLSRISSFCPQFHLSLQSGCDATLERMNRHYSTELYLEKCRMIRRCFDRPAITTDVIVGFPGETEEEFAQTVKFMDEAAFSRMHVFRYSRRSGTRAAVMPDQVDPQVQARRSDALLEVSRRLQRAFITDCADKVMDVLIEEESVLDGEKYMTGYSRNYIRCAFADENLKPGVVVKGKIDRIIGNKTAFCKEID